MKTALLALCASTTLSVAAPITFTAGPTLPSPTTDAAAIRLGNGTVYVMGGNSGNITSAMQSLSTGGTAWVKATNLDQERIGVGTGQTGYAHIYHVFLPPFQNFPNSDIFCAYHASADFADLGHVPYTVEPSQAVATGCQVARGSINGSLVDSTYNLLSHEMFETITDPDGFSWYNTTSRPLFELEVGDVCEFVTPNLFDVLTFWIGNKNYAV